MQQQERKYNRRLNVKRVILSALTLVLILLSSILIKDIVVAKSSGVGDKWIAFNQSESPLGGEAAKTNEQVKPEKTKDTEKEQPADPEPKDDTDQQAQNDQQETTEPDEQAPDAETPDQGTDQEEQATEKKIVYLTFDDGPNENTEGILELLDRYDAKATFFMLEPNMKTYSTAIQDMVAAGHSIGMHGVSHDVKKIYQSKDSVVGEMKQGQATLQELTGVTSDLIRVPYGSVPNMTPAYRQAVNDAGFHLWDWDIDSEDWRFLSPAYVPNVMKQLEDYQYHETPRVILMHDKKTTLASLDRLLQQLTEQGYEMKAIDQEMEPVTFRG